MRFKTFQREDLARAALHDGLILGQDTGLGKTIAAYVWPLLKVGLLRNSDGTAVRPICPADPVLLVASGDLHEQIIAEGLRHFRTRPTLLDSQETFLRLSSLDPAGRRTMPPGYYLTTYTQLTRNGVTPFPKLDLAHPDRLLVQIGLGPVQVEEFYAGRAGQYQTCYKILGVGPDDTLSTLKAHWFRARKGACQSRQQLLDEAYYLLKDFAPPTLHAPRSTLHDLDPAQQTAVAARFAALAHAVFAAGLGQSRPPRGGDSPVKCVFSPTLVDLCADAFAVVVADEAVKLKGEDTLIGAGTRQMNPRFRLPMTATPIKNRLPDIFRVAHWATGSQPQAHARFPFGEADAEIFAEQFLVTERNLSAEARAEAASGSKRRFVKRTPQVCNIHRLWKLFSPIVLRRRKTDCGEELVKMTRHVVRVPMGAEQARVYRFHLEAEYLDKNGRPAPGAQLQALRIAAANPASTLLERPESDTKTPGSPRSSQSYIPKLASALALIHQVLERREQAVVFSAFHDSLDALAACLVEAGVRHVTLDGRTPPARRGPLAARFQKGPPLKSQISNFKSQIPVLLAGVDCMAEGHSFHRCNNVILIAYSWAMDKFIQAINRVWRLNSERDINMYAILCAGSIDRKLEANIQEKGDAAELVLDGALLGQDPEKVNLAELLQIAHREFAQAGKAGAAAIHESDLLAQWPALRASLAQAMAAWDSGTMVSAPRPAAPRCTPARPHFLRPPTLAADNQKSRLKNGASININGHFGGDVGPLHRLYVR